MTHELPITLGRCTTCDRDHYVSVRFCPFCGAEQTQPYVEASVPPPPPPTVVQAASTSVALVPISPSEPPAAESHPAAAPDLAPPIPIPSVHPTLRRRKGLVRLRQVMLAHAAIVGLAALALAHRDVVPAATRIEVGAAWTPVALRSFRNLASLRITAEGMISLRIDGERVQRVSPSNAATIRPRTLRSLELRASRGPVTVTLTPRGE